MPNTITLEWPNAGAFIAAVGPAAVTVCLDLAHESESSGRRIIVVTTLRDIAGRVGLSKDTVHRHVRQLESAGVVARAADPPKFSATTYELHLDTTGIHIEVSRTRPKDSTNAPVQHAKPKSETSKLSTTRSGQPALPFDD